MVFNGSKQSCPNYEGGDLDLSWDIYNDNLNGIEPDLRRKYNKTCFGVCEEDKYVKEGECAMCEGDKTAQAGSNELGDYKDEGPNYDECIRDDNKKECPDDGYNDAGDCDMTPEPLWFQKQKAGNLKHESKAHLALKPEMWYDAQRPMTDLEIVRYLGTRVGNMMDSNTFTIDDYRLHKKYMKEGKNKIKMDKLREDINKGRGDTIICYNKGNGGKNLADKWKINEKSTLDTKYRGCWKQKKKKYGNKKGNFGPEHIIPEELEDFYMEEYLPLIESESDISGLPDFSNLLSGLQSDSAFEQCVNDSLNTPGSDDFEIQKRISKYTSIKEFSSKDIHYLKGKLRKIITMKTNQINECMNLLNLGKSICATGVADKTLMIGSLIFKIIGNDKIDIMKADNDERYKLNKLVDELGPLIPRAVKNIIHISKEYETRVCNVPSNTTLLLERLYTDLYDKQTHVTLDISPYIDFESLTKTNNFWHFIQKIIVIIVSAVLLFAGANFAMVFLSRATVITRVNGDS